MLIYGSYAMKYWFPHYFREPKDIDVVVYNIEKYDNKFLRNLEEKTGLPVEVNYAPYFDIFKDNLQESILIPDDILSVRISHAMYNYNLHKTILDIIFLKKQGAVFDVDKVNHLRKFWKVRYRNFREQMNMEQSPEVFFNSNVARYIKHDELHEKLKLDSIPAFEKILRDPNGETVAVSKNKFESLSYEEQLSTVLEEVFVLACERHYKEIKAKDAYLIALADFITRMTSGWYNLFILDNIEFFWTFNNPEIFDKMKEIMDDICSYEAKNYDCHKG